MEDQEQLPAVNHSTSIGKYVARGCFFGPVVNSTCVGGLSKVKLASIRLPSTTSSFS